MTYKELKEKQVGGSHYKKLDPQPWDFYRGFMSREMWKGYLLGNIIDYLVRDKNGLEDLKKAQHLLDVLVATEEDIAIPEEMLRATSGRGPGVDKRTGPANRRKCITVYPNHVRTDFILIDFILRGRGRREDDSIADLKICKREKK